MESPSVEEVSPKTKSIFHTYVSATTGSFNYLESLVRLYLPFDLNHMRGLLG